MWTLWVISQVSSINAVFGKAIQCLAKIGEELYIEALTKGVSYIMMSCMLSTCWFPSQ